MSTPINTDITSQILAKSLTSSTTQAVKTMEALSSGKKIDDQDNAANLEISDMAQSQLSGSSVASENSQEGVNVLQTADSGLSSIQDNLQQIRDLSLQAANGTYNQNDKSAIAQQISQLTDQINNTSKTTSFNNQNLLDGSSTGMTIQTGANSDSSQNSVNIGSALASSNASSLNLPTGDDLKTALASSKGAASLISNIDSAISSVSTQRASVGSYQNTLTSNIDNLSVQQSNLAASKSTITDTDTASATASLVQSQIKQNASASLLAQANQLPSIALTLL